VTAATALSRGCFANVSVHVSVTDVQRLRTRLVLGVAIHLYTRVNLSSIEYASCNDARFQMSMMLKRRSGWNQLFQEIRAALSPALVIANN
jgi:hypothetical protein